MYSSHHTFHKFSYFIFIRALQEKMNVRFREKPELSDEYERRLKMIIAFVKEQILSGNRCILIVTHDARINEFADRIIHMEDGRITGLEKGTE